MNGKPAELKRGELVRQVDHVAGILSASSATVEERIAEIGTNDQAAREGIGHSGKRVDLLVSARTEDDVSHAGVDQPINAVLGQVTTRHEHLNRGVANDLSNKRLILATSIIGVYVVQVYLSESERRKRSMGSGGVDRGSGGWAGKSHWGKEIRSSQLRGWDDYHDLTEAAYRVEGTG